MKKKKISNYKVMIKNIEKVPAKVLEEQVSPKYTPKQVSAKISFWRHLL